MKQKTIFFLPIILFLFSCESSNISLVKTGVMEICDFTVGEMVDSYFSDPVWEEIIGDDDGRTYVNVSGGMTYNEEPVNALLQFKIRDNMFQVNALEIDGEGMGELLILGLLNNMCDEAF